MYPSVDYAWQRLLYPVRDRNESRCAAMCNYEIRVNGHLDKRHLRWFEGLSITHLPDGETHITGPLVDRTALYGLLGLLRDLGLTLLAVNRIGDFPDPDAEE